MAIKSHNSQKMPSATERYVLRGFEPALRAKLYMLWQKTVEAEPERPMTWDDVQNMLSRAMEEIAIPKARPEMVEKCRADLTAGRYKTTAEYLELLRGRIVAADHN